MENIIFYGRKQEQELTLDYYMIEEDIGGDYIDMSSYGVRIEGTRLYPGGGKTVEMKQLNNIFYKYVDADIFIRKIMNSNVTPLILHEVVKEYIAENVMV